MLTEQHIEQRGIRDPEVLRVIRSIARTEFVPPHLVQQAYEDCPLDIGYGATISQPYIVAAMTELLQLARHHRVLEIGTGSGYQTAILAELAAEVFSIEVVPELAASAEERLRRMAYGNVHVRNGDGYQGWPEEALFDRVILTAAPQELPEALVTQLANNGKLIAPVGGQDQQQLIEVDKDNAGRVTRRVVFPVMFVPMVKATIWS